MTQDHDQTRAELVGGKFDAADLRRRDDVARHANDEQITEALVEDQFDRDPGIRAGEHDRKRRLPADELGATGVKVNSVCPGFVKTPLTEGFNIPKGADMDLMAKLMPLTDGAEPDEIAAAVAYLASDEARFVTGVALPIDGAQTTG